MGKGTSIQWCDDTVNPTTGCEGCELWHATRKGSCYAGNFHEQRLSKSLPHLYAADFTEVRLAHGRMAKAAGWSDLTGIARPGKPWLDGMPRTIFVSDMSDAMSRSVHFLYLKEEVIDVVMSPKGRRHVWMWLTKRPERMARFAELLGEEFGIGWPENLWPGTSITGRTSLSRIDHLLEIPSERRFLSVEPLVESVDLGRWLTKPHMVGRITEAHGGTWLRYPNFESGLSLVIVGGESGSLARPFDIRWARSIRDQCRAAGVPYFLKQYGARPYDSGTRISIDGPDSHAVAIDLKDSHGGDWSEWAAQDRVRQFPRPASTRPEPTA
jgi:protein gp37